LRSENGCYRFSVAAAAPKPTGAADVDIRLPLAGRFQVRNAVTAIAAARLLADRGLPLDDAAIARGLAAVRWPGRLELLQPATDKQPAVYLDGTHNPAGARELVSFWNEHLAGRPIHLVYGTMRDKAVDEVAGLLFPRATNVILTQSRQPRSLHADTLATMTRHLAPALEIVPDPGVALQRAIELAALGEVVFATGSLYLVGDLRRYWQSRVPGDVAASVVPSAAVPHP
jgi:dihydrofolate synthase/folylpolyglutamate synthase